MLFPSFSDRGKAQAQRWCCSYLELPGPLCVLCSGEYLRSTVTAISTDHNRAEGAEMLFRLCCIMVCIINRISLDLSLTAKFIVCYDRD